PQGQRPAARIPAVRRVHGRIVPAENSRLDRPGIRSRAAPGVWRIATRDVECAGRNSFFITARAVANAVALEIRGDHSPGHDGSSLGTPKTHGAWHRMVASHSPTLGTHRDRCDLGTFCLAPRSSDVLVVPACGRGNGLCHSPERSDQPQQPRLAVARARTVPHTGGNGPTSRTGHAPSPDGVA